MIQAMFVFAALCMAGAPAFAGSLYLSWNNCARDVGASTSVAFDCSDYVPQSLYVTYHLDAATAGIVAVSGGIDIAVNGGPLPDFWHMDATGCNATGLGIDNHRANTACTDAGGLAEFHDSLGEGTFIYQHLTNVNGNPSRARFIWAVVVPSSGGVTLQGGGTTRQFACELNFFDDNSDQASGTCVGCGAVVSVHASWVMLERPLQNGDEEVAAIIVDTDPGSQASTCVNATDCDPLPNRVRTWGQTKSLYRR